MAGDGLALLDIDSYREAADGVPAWAEELPDTYTVKSPHGGEHRYYAVDGDVSNSNQDWGEVRADNQYVVGPGSVLDSCTKDWHDCSEEGEGEYTVVHDIPIASISADDLPEDTDENATTGGHDWDEELPEVDEELADVGEAVLRDLQDRHTPAFNSLVELLQGDDGGYDELIWEQEDDGRQEMNRSLQELVALTRLHEAVVYSGKEEGERAEAITRSTFERYVCEHRTTADGRVRKWLEKGEEYKRDRLGRAFTGTDRGLFQRFLNRRPVEEEWQRWTGDYSVPTRGHVWFALDLLSGVFDVDPDNPDLDELRDFAAVQYSFDLNTERLAELLDNPPVPMQGVNPPSGGEPSGPHRDNPPAPVHSTTRGGPGSVPPSAYPTKQEVIEAARVLHGGYNEETSYDEVLKRLRRDGFAALACIEEGVDYRYYPGHRPDPPQAEYVRTAGEVRDPETCENPDTSSGELLLRTDGGADTSTTTSTDGSTDDRYAPETLRERFPTVVRGSGDKSRKHHIPDNDASSVEPLCDTYLLSQWIEKDVDVFPPGWRGWCEDCVDAIQEQERTGRELTESSWTVRQWEREHGNVLEAEWGSA